MKRAALILAALAAILTAAAAPVRTATENFVANKIAEAVAAATNGLATKAEVDAKADKTNVYTKSDVDAKVDAVDNKADEAYSSAEQMVDAVNSLAGTIGTHIRDTKNPHKVTAAQVGAATPAIGAVVENIMSNNVVVYRSGFSDSFAALVIFTEDDILAITEARWIERTAARIVVEVDYVSTADLGAIKPAVLHHNTLDGGHANFEELAEANVTAPVYHAESRTYDGQTFAGYYTITATIPNPSGTSSYFLWIKADGDAPSGDGTTLDLPNGVTGGYTGDVVWGDKVLTFRGGVLKGVAGND